MNSSLQIEAFAEKKLVVFINFPPSLCSNIAVEMAAENAIDNQFIFREVEFEDDKFHAASFVAKYRRVTSLESLRDQLRLYCDALKQQLYGIINRDYKDFIIIATKVLFENVHK